MCILNKNFHCPIKLGTSLLNYALPDLTYGFPSEGHKMAAYIPVSHLRSRQEGSGGGGEGQRAMDFHLYPTGRLFICKDSWEM